MYSLPKLSWWYISLRDSLNWDCTSFYHCQINYKIVKYYLPRVCVLSGGLLVTMPMQARKMQEKGWKPRWFAKDKGSATYKYIGGYWKAREEGKWDECPDIFGLRRSSWWAIISFKSKLISFFIFFFVFFFSFRCSSTAIFEQLNSM